MGLDEDVEGIKQYLHFRADHGSPVEKFVLKYGRPYTAQALPFSFKQGESGACFRNAALLVCKHEGLTYVEGWATRYIPIHHAWCVDAAGRVIDVTWEDPHKGVYFGVPVARRLLWSTINRTQVYGVLYPNEMADLKFLEHYERAAASCEAVG